MSASAIASHPSPVPSAVELATMPNTTAITIQQIGPIAYRAARKGVRNLAYSASCFAWAANSPDGSRRTYSAAISFALSLFFGSAARNFA